MPVKKAKKYTTDEDYHLHSASVPNQRHNSYVKKLCARTHPSLISDPISACQKYNESFTNLSKKMCSDSQSSNTCDQKLKISEIARSSWSNAVDNDHLATRKNAKIDDDLCVSTSWLSNSLLEILPHNENKHRSTSYTAKPESIVYDPLYSFDKKWPNPNSLGHNVDLGKLVERAEKKWEIKMIEKIVEGEYEVLDGKGENITLLRKGKKGSKQKVERQPSNQPCILVDEDDGFEII